MSGPRPADDRTGPHTPFDFARRERRVAATELTDAARADEVARHHDHPAREGLER